MKTNKISLIVAAVALTAVSNVNAGVISATNLNLADAGDLIISVAGVPIENGIAQAGFFNTGFDVSAAILSANYTSLFANFNSLASGQIGDPGVLGAGKFGLYFVGGDYGAPGPSAPLNSILYTFLGSGATLAGSSHIGLLQSSATIGVDTPTPDSNDLIASDGTVRLGQTGTINYAFGAAPVSTPNLNLMAVSVIPEPSAALLGAIGALGLLRRRRI
jgi:hypothetical protein